MCPPVPPPASTTERSGPISVSSRSPYPDGSGPAGHRAVRPGRPSAERGVPAYFPSLSSRTMVYKGMLTPDQLPAF
ncbi:hypothetical protein AB0I95_28825, partial [Micromonospora sp. NPDC049751]|uniref:hypothetical protein n=1 Tax=Micromonospora sp. NPDC049751 TaxID=3154837 RepID=UPI0033D55A78